MHTDFTDFPFLIFYLCSSAFICVQTLIGQFYLMSANTSVG